MMYHYSQQLTSNVRKVVYEITTPDKGMVTSLWFVSDLERRANNKTQKKQLISSL